MLRLHWTRAHAHARPHMLRLAHPPPRPRRQVRWAHGLRKVRSWNPVGVPWRRQPLREVPGRAFQHIGPNLRGVLGGPRPEPPLHGVYRLRRLHVCQRGQGPLREVPRGPLLRRWREQLLRVRGRTGGQLCEGGLCQVLGRAGGHGRRVRSLRARLGARHGRRRYEVSPLPRRWCLQHGHAMLALLRGAAARAAARALRQLRRREALGARRQLLSLRAAARRAGLGAQPPPGRARVLAVLPGHVLQREHHGVHAMSKGAALGAGRDRVLLVQLRLRTEGPPQRAFIFAARALKTPWGHARPR